MAGGRRVAWREGQFLRPQHFQQLDRAVDARLNARVDSLGPYRWGLTELVFDEDMAADPALAATLDIARQPSVSARIVINMRRTSG